MQIIKPYLDRLSLEKVVSGRISAILWPVTQEAPPPLRKGEIFIAICEDRNKILLRVLKIKTTALQGLTPDDYLALHSENGYIKIGRDDICTAALKYLPEAKRLAVNEYMALKFNNKRNTDKQMKKRFQELQDIISQFVVSIIYFKILSLREIASAISDKRRDPASRASLRAFVRAAHPLVLYQPPKG